MHASNTSTTLSSSPENDGLSIKAAKLPAFSFAPLISTSVEGVHQTGDVAGVAPKVIQSITNQLDILQGRVQTGKSPSVPSASYTTGCLWSWTMKWGKDCRWTLSSPRTFACATCFNARRACFLWQGNTKYIILPLPSAVRRVEASSEDADYFIHREAGLKSEHFPGVWDKDGRFRKSS